MKIAHVIPELVKGGAEQVVVLLANEGVRSGDEVTIIVACDSDPALLHWKLDPRVRVRIAGGRRGMRGYAALPFWIAANKGWLSAFDVIHCHLTFGALFGFVFQFAKSRVSRGPALVFTSHAVGMPIPAWKRSVEHWLRRRFDAIALVAHEPGRDDRGRSSVSPVAVIPNGIVPLKTALPDCENAGNRLTIGTLGRLVAERKPAEVLQALAVAARIVGHDARIIVGGAGPELDNLERLAVQLGISGQVQFQGLVIDPLPFLAQLDLYVSVNVGPQTGIAGLEAASSGVPVVALQALPDYFAKPDDWIWSTADPRELGEAAARLLHDAPERRALASRQHQTVLAHHSAAAMHAHYLALYRAAAAARPST